MNRLISIIFLISFNSFACEYELKFKQNISDLVMYKEKIQSLLIDKDFYNTKNPKLKFLVKMAKRVDPHSASYFAHSSISVRKIENNEIVFYVHGQGKPNENPHIAYGHQNFLVSFENAIKHLPKCDM